jgi:glycosyltransferase involved in cell wall biosynthesis
MNVLLWHVHGSWTSALVHGRHRYLLPVDIARSPWGRGRAETWDWPPAAEEVTASELEQIDVDVVILQRPEELSGLAARWLGGRRPGVEVPALYVEHNAPQGRINDLRHPAAGVPGVTVVHVTHFNDLFWDCGPSRTVVVEHGVVDPGARYTGELGRQAVVINEPQRRGRVTGTDLLGRFIRAGAVDLFGMGAAAYAAALDEGHLAGIENLRQDQLHTEMARRRVYVHPVRWTSLGLSLIEAMHLGMPVVALATTAVCEAVPAAAGIVSNDVERLVDASRRLLADAEEAAAIGKAARAHALECFGLTRFLSDWDRLLEEATT